MPDPLTDDWMNIWAETQKALVGQFTGPASAGGIAAIATPAAGAGADAIRRLIEFGDDYLGITRELWKFIESSKAQDAGASPQSLHAGLERLRTTLADKLGNLYLPAFEPLREQQQAHERLVAVTLRWQHAAERVSQQLATVAADAVDRLVAALTGTDERGPQVTSLRELHDLWVDCGERAYAAAAHGDDFAAAQAELLAAMVEMRFEQRRQAEEWAQAFNLPTRAQIDAIHERLHALRRRVADLERELGRREEPRR